MKYTVAEFRKNMREILDAADRGEPVEVVRFDKAYTVLPSRTNAMLTEKERQFVGSTPPLVPPPFTLKAETPKKPFKVQSGEVQILEEAKPMPDISKLPKAKLKLCPHGNPLGQCYDKKKNRNCV